VFSGGELEIIPTQNEHVLGFKRTRGTDRAFIFANFSEAPQTITVQVLENRSVRAERLVYGKSNLLDDQKRQIGPLDFLVFISE
jgi:hypothetical protein